MGCTGCKKANGMLTPCKDLECLKTFDEPVHQSELAIAERCPRKWLYRYRWRIGPRVEEYTPAATLGQIYHRLKGLGPDGIDTVRAEIITKQKALMDKITSGEDLTGELARIVQSLTELFDKALMMVTLFWETYPYPEWLEVLFKEQEIMDVWEGLEIAGRIDEIDKDNRNGSLWIRDSKTTGRTIDEVLTGYEYSLQCRFYRLLASLLVRQDPLPEPTGFILDIVQTPGIKFCKKDKDFKAYTERCKQWYLDNGKDVMRSMAILYNEPLIHPELEKALMKVKLLKAYPATVINRYSRDVTGTACTAWSRICLYYPLCSTATAGWPALIENEYSINEPEQPVELTGTKAFREGRLDEPKGENDGKGKEETKTKTTDS